MLVHVQEDKKRPLRAPYARAKICKVPITAIIILIVVAITTGMISISSPKAISVRRQPAPAQNLWQAPDFWAAAGDLQQPLPTPEFPGFASAVTALLRGDGARMEQVADS